ncbi:MAG: hypothetical protein H0Z35_12475 [Thermoanaerobacteraceae bacterium]|nr:hypothetical protein [Thermoanaerobacteraceae bacterium]
MAMKEADLFEPLKCFFAQDPGNKIYTEVDIGRRPDLVIKNGNIITVVEMKTSLSMTVMEQAFRWKHKVHYVYIAIPKRKQHINWYAERCLRRDGIGILEIDMRGGRYERIYRDHPETRVTVLLPAKLHRLKDFWIKNWERGLDDIYLVENNVAGGHAGGGYNTSYKVMIDEVRRFLKYSKKGEWTTVNEILDHVERPHTHYAAPRSSLFKALREIETDWCESKKINGRIHFRYSGGEKNAS